jgi:acyl-CoA thioester hydrolase
MLMADVSVPAVGQHNLAISMGEMIGVVHHFPLRVFYEDTDAAGLVYYANYLKFVERARTEMMRLLGVTHSTMKQQTGLVFVVRRCAVDYGRPARLDDELVVKTRMLALGGASIELEQIVTLQGATLVSAILRLACINAEGRAARLPGSIRDVLAPLMHK